VGGNGRLICSSSNSTRNLTDSGYRAELGRAAWKVLHLMTLRYPEVRPPDIPIASDNVACHRNRPRTTEPPSNPTFTSSPACTLVASVPRNSKPSSKNIHPKYVCLPTLRRRTAESVRHRRGKRPRFGCAPYTISSTFDLGRRSSIA